MESLLSKVICVIFIMATEKNSNIAHTCHLLPSPHTVCYLRPLYMIIVTWHLVNVFLYRKKISNSFTEFSEDSNEVDPATRFSKYRNYIDHLKWHHIMEGVWTQLWPVVNWVALLPHLGPALETFPVYRRTVCFSWYTHTLICVHPDIISFYFMRQHIGCPDHYRIDSKVLRKNQAPERAGSWIWISETNTES